MNQHTHYIEEAWTRAPVTPPERQRALIERIRALLKRERAVLIAHYYVAAALQELAEQTGGCVADSLEMARFGRDSPARTLMPDLEATCSLDLSCPPDAFGAWRDAHPDRTAVVYANTCAAVKARADW